MDPCFVDLGLEGGLTDKWTKYNPHNSVERQYTCGNLHPEADLGVPLAVSSMDCEGAAYTDHDRKQGVLIIYYGGANKETTSGQAPTNTAINGIKSAALHPNDNAIIYWKGSSGETNVTTHQTVLLWIVFLLLQSV